MSDSPSPNPSPSPIEAYKALAEELRAGVGELETFYQERTSLTEHLELLSAREREVGDQLFQARTDPAKCSQLESKLEEIDRDTKVCAATLEALTRHLETLEADLHNKLPKSCFTFERLVATLRDTVLELQQAAIDALIHPSKRDACREIVQKLAEHSQAVQELADINLPSGGTWSLNRSLDANDSDRQARPQTMQLIVSETKRLLQNVDRIFTEMAKHEAIHLPVFLLGEPEPELPIEPTIQPANADLNSFSEEDQLFVRELCRESGRDPDKLTDDERAVLQNSLQNWHASRLTGQRRMSVGSY